MPKAPRITTAPVTPDRWKDFRSLFERGGWPKQCWCMYWRVPGSSFWEAQKDETPRGMMQKVIRSGAEPGLIASIDGEPVGWVSIAPRAEFPRIERSKNFNKADGTGVWSLNCFVIDPKRRGQGVATALLEAAVDHARAHGAKAVEAYPADRDTPTSNDYTGTVPMFARAGFRRIADGSKVRAVMRKSLRPR